MKRFLPAQRISLESSRNSSTGGVGSRVVLSGSGAGRVVPVVGARERRSGERLPTAVRFGWTALGRTTSLGRG